MQYAKLKNRMIYYLEEDIRNNFTEYQDMLIDIFKEKLDRLPLSSICIYINDDLNEVASNFKITKKELIKLFKEE